VDTMEGNYQGQLWMLWFLWKGVLVGDIHHCLTAVCRDAAPSHAELQGWERKCREASKHRMYENVKYFGHDPVNFRSDHAKQACDHRAIAGRDRSVSSDSSLDYSR
jgi:hypothetical protein